MVWQAYDAHAVDYARVLDPTLAPAVERVVELAGAGMGVRLLDLATGTGTIARAAARRGADAVAVDLAPAMVAAAAEQSPEIEYRVADAHLLPFDAASFDAVTCGLSVSHFAGPARALGEALRVLRPRGRFVASTWGQGGEVPFSPSVSELLARHGAAEHGYELAEETWFGLEAGAQVLREAGFEIVSATTETFTGRFEDPEQALAWALAWPVRAARVERLDPRARASFLTDARAALSSDLSWRFAFNFFVARRPSSEGGSPDKKEGR